MNGTRRPLGAAWLGALLACGCGVEVDGLSDAPVAEGDGMVTASWSQYCVATFTEDYEVIDFFGEPEFTVRAGEAYLMMDYGSSFGENAASLAYLTDYGPYEFEVVAPEGTQDFPFTSNCTFDAGVSLYAVFADVTVFADEALTSELCSLQAGTVTSSEGGQRGYALAGDLQLFGPLVYEVYLDGFSDECDGAQSGFVEVPEVQVLGTTTNLVPIQSVLAPGP